MNINNAFESKHLKASDFPPGLKVTVTIERVEVETIGQGNDQTNKPVVYFSGKKKGLVLNVTNANMITEIAGGKTETDEWTGLRIALHSTKVDYQGKRVDALRVDYPPQQRQNPIAPNLGIAPSTRADSDLRRIDDERQNSSASTLKTGITESDDIPFMWLLVTAFSMFSIFTLWVWA